MHQGPDRRGPAPGFFRPDPKVDLIQEGLAIGLSLFHENLATAGQTVRALSAAERQALEEALNVSLPAVPKEGFGEDVPPWKILAASSVPASPDKIICLVHWEDIQNSQFAVCCPGEKVIQVPVAEGVFAGTLAVMERTADPVSDGWVVTGIDPFLSKVALDGELMRFGEGKEGILWELCLAKLHTIEGLEWAAGEAPKRVWRSSHTDDPSSFLYRDLEGGLVWVRFRASVENTQGVVACHFVAPFEPVGDGPFSTEPDTEVPKPEQHFGSEKFGKLTLLPVEQEKLRVSIAKWQKGLGSKEGLRIATEDSGLPVERRPESCSEQYPIDIGFIFKPNESGDAAIVISFRDSTGRCCLPLNDGSFPVGNDTGDCLGVVLTVGYKNLVAFLAPATSEVQSLDWFHKGLKLSGYVLPQGLFEAEIDKLGSGDCRDSIFYTSVMKAIADDIERNGSSTSGLLLLGVRKWKQVLPGQSPQEASKCAEVLLCEHSLGRHVLVVYRNMASGVVELSVAEPAMNEGIPILSCFGIDEPAVCAASG